MGHEGRLERQGVHLLGIDEAPEPLEEVEQVGLGGFDLARLRGVIGTSEFREAEGSLH